SLTDLPHEEAVSELVASKSWLDGLIQKETAMFCFPNGKWNIALKDATKQAGYSGARTTEKLAFEIPSDGFQIPVTIMCAPFPLRRTDNGNIYWRHALGPLKTYGTPLLRLPPLWTFSWGSFAR